MEKIIFGFILFLSATSWGKSESVTYGELRPRLLIQAKADLFEVMTLPELTMPSGAASIDLKLSAYHQKGVKKNNFYRISYVSSFDAYGSDSDKPEKVYNFTAQELDQNLRPTDVIMKFAAKATPTTEVGNFTQHVDELSLNPTLLTGRAQIGDHIVNSLPVILNNEKLPAYSKFEVIGITDEYIPFTLSFKYTLRLRDERTGRLYDLAAPGLRSIPIWAHIVAPKNLRMIKMGGAMIFY